ncbi:hypothetical protein LTR37_005766 [Vermiconidia calcicola]|uniref:Uncharacterized protein n=1 Tax=Vermiconidia calcicola TaxID=1690605 RepID=A0ACC3NIM8_9PEZI|nr:hypothetical protein LTR37_005766 [Vermiconidia calcicola]
MNQELRTNGPWKSQHLSASCGDAILLFALCSSWDWSEGRDNKSNLQASSIDEPGTEDGDYFEPIDLEGEDTITTVPAVDNDGYHSGVEDMDWEPSEDPVPRPPADTTTEQQQSSELPPENELDNPLLQLPPAEAQKTAKACLESWYRKSLAIDEWTKPSTEAAWMKIIMTCKRVCEQIVRETDWIMEWGAPNDNPDASKFSSEFCDSLILEASKEAQKFKHVRKIFLDGEEQIKDVDALAPVADAVEKVMRLFRILKAQRTAIKRGIDLGAVDL